MPNYLVLSRLHLMDTAFAVILPGIFSTFPVFIIKKGFDAVPDLLLELPHWTVRGRCAALFPLVCPWGFPPF